MTMRGRADAATDGLDIADNLGWPASAVNTAASQLSLQVLQEFFAAATQKLGLSALDARRRIEVFSTLDVVRLDVEDVLAAVDLHRLHALSIWDALVVRAAVMSGCRTLYTEDLRHGRRFEGLLVVDPFRAEEGAPPP